MKKPLFAAILSIFAAGAQADVGMMVGVAYNFGGQASLKNLGFTAKILSSDKEKNGSVPSAPPCTPGPISCLALT